MEHGASPARVPANSHQRHGRTDPHHRRAPPRQRQGNLRPRLEPLYDRILVRLLRPDERTRGGLCVPRIATDNTPYLKAEVVAVGQGRITTSGAVIPLRVAVGDVVLFFRSQSSGEQLVFPSDDNEELMLIREPNVACVLRDLDKVTSIVGLDGGNLELRS